MATQNNILKTKMLITVIDRGMEPDVIKIYNRHDMLFHFVIQAYGLASSEILQSLGLDEIDKSVILSIIPENMENTIFYNLEKKFKINDPGRGIAFTIPFTSSSVSFAECDNETLEKEKVRMKNNVKHELILTILTDGYADQVMELARSLGATGGTLIHGKGLGAAEATKFLGITIQPEKDIILILTNTDNKHSIMEAIVREFGLTTKGKGICFSLPVDEVAGIEEKLLNKNNSTSII